ncbi:isoamyl acetate-hydrolyzing esterase 1 homolog isoform X1 [Limanda limanda]|uniref:isoamyl acetate-hydrolyzing esterase 1 homolog isoform X1 n=1 Tax=Limanda limanda TaxID=27771 RepID=UPI0029C88E31|nr:isoamyl acetate-hydrolyzing esterase 1 homolog isoform X1 [Limanda limanda]
MMSKLKTIVWPKVIFFGDSITQFSFQPNGWGADITHRLASCPCRKCDVVNRGLSGYNSRWAKIVLPRLISSHSSDDNINNIAAVTVFFGANDCALEDKNPQQHIPLQEYSENLKEIIRLLALAGVSADRVIFITPPPLHEPAWEKECILKGCPLNRHNSVAGQYAQACVQAAGQCGTDVLDLWTLMQKDGQDYTVYLSDGLHLSEKGNQFVAQHLWGLLESRVAHLPFILPYWGDVDAKSPDSSLLCDQ